MDCFPMCSALPCSMRIRKPSSSQGGKNGSMQPQVLTSGSANVSSLSVGPLMKPRPCTSAPVVLGSPVSACCAGVADGPGLPAGVGEQGHSK